MLNNILFIIDLKRIILGDILSFFKKLKDKNSNIKKLFKLDNNKDKNLLIVSLGSLSYRINIEGLFAKYFNDKGYKIHFLSNFQDRRGIKTFKYIGGTIINYRFIYWKNALKIIFKKLPIVKTAEELKDFKYKGINIGINVYSSVSARVKMGKLDFSNKQAKRIAKRYLWRSIVYFETGKEIIRKIKPDLILANEKGYIGNSEIFYLAIEKGINFIQWCNCHETNSVVFKRYTRNNIKDHPFSVSLETWNRFVNIPWKEEWGRQVYESFEKGYLSQEWFKYKNLMTDSVVIDKQEFIDKYNLDSNKKIAVLFSHVLWDANLFYGDDLFEKGFGQWLVESVKIMEKNKEVNWLVKIHPANKFKHNIEKISGEYREIEAIKEELGGIPDNVKIIYPEDNINPYALFNIIDYGITVRGTIGAEMPCFSIPMLTAGTGRYSNRGFTIDSQSKEEYLDKLSNLQDLPRLSEEQKRLALIHAYLFFKKRPFKLSSVKEKSFGLERDVEILIDKPEQGKDFIRFVNWAINSDKEDILSSEQLKTLEK